MEALDQIGETVVVLLVVVGAAGEDGAADEP